MSGWKDWEIGEVVEAGEFQTFIQDQVVQVYADSSARGSALGTAVAEGMASYVKDTDSFEVYDGSGWVPVSVDAAWVTAGTAGQILISNGTADPSWVEAETTLVGGTAGQFVQSAGTAGIQYTDGYLFRETVTFTSNGTFTKADYPWLKAMRVKLVGGGGGGGWANTTTSGQVAVAGGGGGGGYSEKFIVDIAGLSVSETVTVGSGGSGSIFGGATGSNGGSSSFASVSGSGGGLGGNRNAATPPTDPGTLGPPGSGSGGDLNFQANEPPLLYPASAAVVAQYRLGGNTFLTPNGSQFAKVIAATNGGLNGANATQFGQGGGGGCNAQNQATGRDGGDGAAGVVIMELFG